ncbi:DUF3987 domain-containing protein [Dyella caseinilytica]|uniref:DUF3987 domain-containing protein n=1 Tax=Dyella caseinilytica TaxID=1849581 RepID=A0ABX7GQY1_9GAMM|nr:DUF3987 domain-containing protein [Dyella caseinilytica]QRN52227.1 DUF3987 domain-containing protein [Dyella caseinilytica]GGA14203.1 hypothetical protein GCM10011408_39900 [Dyella caseinilytica]
MNQAFNAKIPNVLFGPKHPKQQIVELDFEALSEQLMGDGLLGHLLRVGECPVWALSIGARDAFLEFQKNTSAPPAVILGELLAAMAAALQLAYRVKKLDGVIDLLSLFIIVASETGSGKSLVDRPLIKAFMNHQSALSQKFNDANLRYKREMAKWNAKKKGKAQRVTNLTVRGLQEDDPDLADADKALDDHMTGEPIKPKEPDMLKTDASISDILDTMHHGEKAIFLISDEGESLLKGTIKDGQPDLNHMLDGKPIRHGRRNFKIRIDQPIISMAVATYPKALEKFIAKYGEEAIERGFLGRCLIALVDQKDVTMPEPITNPPWTYVDLFCDTLECKLNEGNTSASTDGFTPTVLHLSPDASRILTEWMEMIQPLMARDGLWRAAKLLSKKSPQLITRVAGILHVFDGSNETEIPADTVKRAIQIVEWYLSQACRIFMVKPLAEKLKKIVKILHTWWNDGHDPVTGYPYENRAMVPKNYVLQHSHMPVEELDALLEMLREFKIFTFYRPTGKTYLDLNVHLFPYGPVL